MKKKKEICKWRHRRHCLLSPLSLIRNYILLLLEIFRSNRIEETNKKITKKNHHRARDSSFYMHTLCIYRDYSFFFFFFFSVYYIAASHYYRGSPADEKTPPRTCDSSVQIRLNLFFFFIFPPKYTKLLANVYQVRCCCITHSLTIVKKKRFFNTQV